MGISNAERMWWHTISTYIERERERFVAGERELRRRLFDTGERERLRDEPRPRRPLRSNQDHCVLNQEPEPTKKTQPPQTLTWSASASADAASASATATTRSARVRDRTWAGPRSAGCDAHSDRCRPACRWRCACPSRRRTRRHCDRVRWRCVSVASGRRDTSDSIVVLTPRDGAACAHRRT